MPVVKMYRGKKSREFGQYEWAASLNWSTLITSVLVAVLTWFASEAVPVLQEHEVLSVGTLTTLTAAIPFLINWLKDNTNKSIDKKL